MTLRAVEPGHAEELLVGVLVVAAALLAADGRAVWSGLALGLAVAGKPWAALAVLPVLGLLPGARALVRCCGAAAAAGLVVMLPFLLVSGGSSGGAVRFAANAASTNGAMFQPWQIFWFLGDHGRRVMSPFGERVGFRAAPDWIAHVSHPLLLVACVALGAAGVLLQRRRGAPAADGLLLLAAVLQLRCLLDTWNNAYYVVPVLLALLAWDVHAHRGRPVLTASVTLAAWVTFQTLRNAAPDLQAAAYLVWAVPLGVALGARALTGRSPVASAGHVMRRPAAPSAAR
jgi:hypothetical protein